MIVSLYNQMTTIRSGDVSALQLYTPAYFELTGCQDVKITTTGSVDRAEGKPFWTQVQELLQSGAVRPEMSSTMSTNEEISVEFPSTTERLTDRYAATSVPLRYDLLQHVVTDLQLQLSYMLAHGVAVWSIRMDDVYCVQVESDEWRYVLLTERMSLRGGSGDALLTFLHGLVGPEYLGTKLWGYKERLRVNRDAEFM